MITDLHKAVEALTMHQPAWTPQVGNDAQKLAWEVDCDVLFVGGAAGGGKTEILNGFATMKGRNVLYLRRTFPQFERIIDRLKEICGTASFNASKNIFRPDGKRGITARMIRLGHIQHDKDVDQYQGGERDTLLFDEATHFGETIVKKLMTWNRSTAVDEEGNKIRTRVVLASNPATNTEGLWLQKMFAPWLDASHPFYPCETGRILYKFLINDIEYWQEDGGIMTKHPQTGKKLPVPVQGLSFSCVRMSWKDNPEYRNNPEYIARLDSLPEPERSAYRDGSFESAMSDEPMQIIKIDPLMRAVQRWRDRNLEERPMGILSAIGQDVARGGTDKTVTSPWHGLRGEVLRKKPGKLTPDGDSCKAEIDAVSDRCEVPVAIDIIGVGSSAYDSVVKGYPNTYQFNAAGKSYATDRSGQLPMVNLNAEMWWKFGEDLQEPDCEIEVPDDPDLIRQLLNRRRKKTTSPVIQIESKDDYRERIGESPDSADAFLIGYWLVRQLSQ